MACSHDTGEQVMVTRVYIESSDDAQRRGELLRCLGRVGVIDAFSHTWGGKDGAWVMVAFPDGHKPQVDWFPLEDVEMLPLGRDGPPESRPAHRDRQERGLWGKEVS